MRHRSDRQRNWRQLAILSEQETIVGPVGESGLQRRNGAVGYEALVAEFLRAGSNQLIRGAS
ncbi:MAG TPA: hypothetical protein PLU01_07355, partial [Nitrospira sp.]|nr:hypothetical protein [Nitrospira sp.]